MLYRRISAVRNPTTKRLLTTNAFLTATPGTYNLSSSIPATLLRNNTNRLLTIKVDVQAPGSGAGNASITAFNCYRMAAQPIQAGSPGTNGAAGCFWTLTAAKNTVTAGSIVLGSPGQCAQGNINPNWSFDTTMLTNDGGWGGRGGRSNSGNNNVGNTGNPGGTLGTGATITFPSPSISFTLPSGGAGGSSGGCGRLKEVGQSNPPTPGVAGAATTASTLGNSGSGGTGGDGGCYVPRPGGVSNNRGSFTPPASGTMSYPNPASPRLIPANSVVEFNANLYGQGGLANSPALTPRTAPTVTSAQNGNNGAIRAIATSIRI